MNASFRIAVLGGALALAACNSTNPPKPEAAVANTDYKKLGGIHAHHTPEQHAAFLKRVGQLPSDDETDVGGGGGGGGGGHHH